MILHILFLLNYRVAFDKVLSFIGEKSTTHFLTQSSRVVCFLISKKEQMRLIWIKFSFFFKENVSPSSRKTRAVCYTIWPQHLVFPSCGGQSYQYKPVQSTKNYHSSRCLCAEHFSSNWCWFGSLWVILNVYSHTRRLTLKIWFRRLLKRVSPRAKIKIFSFMMRKQMQSLRYIYSDFTNSVFFLPNLMIFLLNAGFYNSVGFPGAGKIATTEHCRNFTSE